MGLLTAAASCAPATASPFRDPAVIIALIFVAVIGWYGNNAAHWIAEWVADTFYNMWEFGTRWTVGILATVGAIAIVAVATGVGGKIK